MARTVSTKEQIERELRLGLIPAADNAAVLREMGFEPLYPHVRDGYHEKLWGRQIEAESERGVATRNDDGRPLDRTQAATSASLSEGRTSRANSSMVRNASPSLTSPKANWPRR